MAPTRAVQACSVCGCGDPLLAVGEAPAKGGSLMLGLDAEILSMTAANEEDPSTTDFLYQQTLHALGSFSPLAPLNLVLRVPVTHKRLYNEAQGVRERTSDLVGLGDIEASARTFLWGQVNLMARRKQDLALSLGSSFPTGGSNATSHGERVDEHGQLGTGAFGPFAGLLYRLLWDPFAATANLTGRYRTTNGHGYRYGWAALWTVEVDYQPFDWLGFGLATDGRWAAADVSHGETVPSTGGLVIAGSPSVHLRIVGTLWFWSRVQLPVITALRGRQSVGPVYFAGLQYQLL